MNIVEQLKDLIHPERKRLKEERERFKQKREKLVHVLEKHGLDGAFHDMEQQLAEIANRKRNGKDGQ